MLEQISTMNDNLETLAKGKNEFVYIYITCCTLLNLYLQNFRCKFLQDFYTHTFAQDTSLTMC